MSCVNKTCKIKTNINPRNGLCQSCDQFFGGLIKKSLNQGRQSAARGAQHGTHRDIDQQDTSDMTNETGNPAPSDDVFNFPTLDTQSIPQHSLPKVDLKNLISSYDTLEEDSDPGNKILKNLMGMMMHVYAKQNEIDVVKKTGQENSSRITQLEAKIGGPEDISLRLGLALRFLPLSQGGATELKNVQNAINQVHAQGVDASYDIIKAVRVGYKSETAPGAGNGNLGTVKVEVRTEDARAKIMKSKTNLKNHPDPIFKKLVIQNLKSREEMKNENFHYDILKIATNSNEYYVAGNGHIRKKDQTQPRYGAPPPPTGTQSVFAPPTRPYQHFPAPTQNNHNHQTYPTLQPRTQPPTNNPNNTMTNQQSNRHSAELLDMFNFESPPNSSQQPKQSQNAKNHQQPQQPTSQAGAGQPGVQRGVASAQGSPQHQ